MKKEFGLQSLTSLTIAFSKPHSWFLELLYLIIKGNSNSAIQPNHKNTNLGVIPKTNSTEIQLRKSKLIMKQQSQKPRTLNLGCHRTHPSDRKSCTLAQEYWQEWSGWSRQKHTSHTCSICVTWRNTMWDGGAWCLVLLAHHSPNRDEIMKAVAVHGFKTQCRQHSTHSKMTYPSGIFVTEVSVIWQIMLASLFSMNAPENQYFQSFRKTPLRMIWV